MTVKPSLANSLSSYAPDAAGAVMLTVAGRGRGTYFQGPSHGELGAPGT